MRCPQHGTFKPIFLVVVRTIMSLFMGYFFPTHIARV